MKVLVLGTGGREHALAWRIASSPAHDVFLHPGNPGAAAAGLRPLPGVTGTEADTLIPALQKHSIELVVIGPEALLAQGLADDLRARNFAVLGPSKNSAKLETSKRFAKEFMQRAGIPTASYFTVDSESSLLAQLGERRTWPVVLKLDGLAAGKGVVIASDIRDGESFASRIWTDHEFGSGPHTVLVEEFIAGRELSYIGLCDGNRFLPLASATDYKRVSDGNLGPNTGGMGSVSPSPYLTPALEAKIRERVIQPILATLQKDEMDYRGALYCGLMIDSEENPFVLEFNTRFGDPETQAILLRLESDFAELCLATAQARLGEVKEPKWTEDVSVYVVAAAQGYPSKVTTGDAITGFELVGPPNQVFFSGVAEEGQSLVTGGGRVLGVGGTAPDFGRARERVYRDLKRLYWRGIHFRSDIGEYFA